MLCAQAGFYFSFWKEGKSVHIKRGINNNVTFVVDDEGNELIVTGRGIAFGKHIGDEIDESKIEYYFPVLPHEISSSMAKLLVNIPIEYYAIANDVVDKAKADLKRELNPSLVLALTDHLYRAVEQAKKGIRITNPLFLDIKRIYPQEFQVGLFGINLLQNMTGCQLDDQEAATIALHIVNSESEGDNRFNSYRIVEIVHWVTNYVFDYFKIDFAKKADPLYYQRFDTHVRFFAQRILNNDYKNNDDNSSILFVLMDKQYQREKECVNSLSAAFEQKFNIKIFLEERAYLVLHIHNMLSNIISKEK